jgi:hypothetical protein
LVLQIVQPFNTLVFFAASKSDVMLSGSEASRLFSGIQRLDSSALPQNDSYSTVSTSREERARVCGLALRKTHET